MHDEHDRHDDPTTMRGQPYIGSADPGEAERLAAQEAGALDELRAALALHSPVPYARVLELGCGSGVFTQALLTALPDATVTATDRDETLLSSARQRLAADVQHGRVTFARADVANLPYPARSFDLVACRCLLMHQPDPLLVAAEMYRIASVGGLALAIEPDWGARALYPDAEALADLLDLARRARPFGFPDLLLGRKLYALLRAAGFVQIRLRATAFSETADDRAFQQALAPRDAVATPTGPARLLAQGRALIRGAGLADDAAIDALIARLDAIQHHPEYCSAGLDLTAVAVKPAVSILLGERYR
ncbi:MAG: class I SAM-dependent methyltransferase [Ktedonobacterales bacterium]